MYIVCVRDHFMIAHSFQGKVFGPAQKLHGATYVVDVEFRRLELDTNGIIVDIGLASEVLKTTLNELNYKNLDEDQFFSGKNTTTEFQNRMQKKYRGRFLTELSSLMHNSLLCIPSHQVISQTVARASLATWYPSPYFDRFLIKR